MSTRCSHISRFVCDFCAYDKVLARANIEGREPTFEELDRVLTMAVERTDFHDIFSVLDEFGCDMIPNGAYERMIAIRVNRGDYGLALHAAEVAGRKLTQEETDVVVINGLTLDFNTAQVVRMVHDGKISDAGIAMMIESCLDRALPQTAGFLAERIGHCFSAEEIERLHQSCEKHEHPDRLPQVYSLPTAVTA